jgi:mannose PTS system EIIA component
MIGIVLIAHQPLASALAASVAHIYECAPAVASQQLAVLDIAPGVEMQAAVDEARRLVSGVDRGQGVLVLTDAVGATPCNVAAQLAEPARVAVVAGVNLPMLLRTLCYREGTLSDTVEKAVSGGTQGVMQVTATPVQNQGLRSVAHDPSRLHHQQ